jgi:hypothetical protein
MLTGGKKTSDETRTHAYANRNRSGLYSADPYSPPADSMLPMRVLTHPGYSSRGDNVFDAALVFLPECVALGPAVNPIKVATEAGESTRSLSSPGWLFACVRGLLPSC